MTGATAGRSRRRAAAAAGLGSVGAGAVLGGLWAWIAPPIRAVVAMTRAGERVHDYLGTESQHFFDAPSLMLGLLTVLGVVAPVLAWQWRAHRGPGMVVALTAGMVTAAATATAVGAALVRIRFGALNFDAVPLAKGPSVAYVVQAPPVFFADHPLQVALTLLWPAAIAALVYAVFAAADARDDLGVLPAGSSAALPVAGGGAAEAAVS
ncbi:hypothetical protein A5730_22240 [Mycobacterium sp. ACS4054]|uniref:DUF2567 domain-containing protein n=1 Tax=Mycobacterium sp. ACS4054 TaxID=1834119 RepID=UPI0007FE1347|nr:hypothetical protein A5730_22240 [Mycobacterium sp. ACS4054]